MPIVLPILLVLLLIGETPRTAKAEVQPQSVQGVSFSYLVSSSSGSEPQESNHTCHYEACFPTRVELSSGPSLGPVILNLRGISLFTYWGFRVYVAALYLDPGTQDSVQKQLGETPKHLVIRYKRDFEPEDFRKSGSQIMADNIDTSIAEVASGIALIDKLYQPIKAGDSYSISYLPEQGLTLTKNDQPLGTVPGKLFAKGYFSIWLGENSISRHFTNELLGLER